MSVITYSVHIKDTAEIDNEQLQKTVKKNLCENCLDKK